MKYLLTALLMAALSSTPLHAEKLVITLKDGSEVVGDKTAEDENSLTVLAQNDKGIREPRTLSKSEIRDQRPWGPHDRDFEPIAGMIPTPDLLPAKDYEQRLAGCTRYLEIHKESAPRKQLQRVEAIKAQLEKELALVKEGGLQFDGRWIDKDARETNEYEIDMRIGIAQMQEAAEEGNHRRAMQIFDVIQRDFINSERYDEARQIALEVLEEYKRVVAAYLREVDENIKKREESLIGLSASERAAEEAAIKRIDDRYQKLLAADRERKTKWLTLNEFHKGPMDEVMRSITQSITTLDKPQADTFKAVGPIYRNVWAAIREGDLEKAKETANELKSLKVPDRYMEKINAQIDPPEEPEPDPSTTVTPTEEPAAEEEPGTEEAPEEKPSEEQPEEEPSTSTDSGTPAPSAADSEEEGGLPMKFILIVVLVVVIAGALVAAFGGKKK